MLSIGSYHNTLVRKEKKLLLTGSKLTRKSNSINSYYDPRAPSRTTQKVLQNHLRVCEGPPPAVCSRSKPTFHRPYTDTTRPAPHRRRGGTLYNEERYLLFVRNERDSRGS